MKLEYIQCPTNEIKLENLCGMVSVGNYLFINQQFLLSVWDITNPCEIKKVNEYEFPDSRSGIRLIDGDIYVYGESFSEDDSQVHILDISDPLNIKEKQCITLPSEIQAVTSVNRNIFVATSDGIYNSNNKIIFDINTSYGCDIIAHDEWLIYSGPHEGIRIFRFLSDGNLELVKHITTMLYMPYGLIWDVPGKSFFVVGLDDESVLKFDMSVPEKTKRVKGAKTGANLCAQHVRENDTLWVFGIKVLGTTSYVVEVDVAGAIPEVKAKHEIKGYLPKRMGSDSARGIIRAGEYLLIATYYCMLGVLKIC